MPFTIEQITSAIYPIIRHELREVSNQWTESALLRALEFHEVISPVDNLFTIAQEADALEAMLEVVDDGSEELKD